jgi:hypothetical protein
VHLNGASLFSASEDCGHNARTTTSMDHGDNPQRPFVGRISDQVVVDDYKAQRAGSQIRPSVASIGKRHNLANGVKYALSDTTSSLRALACDISPNICSVFGREGM